MAITKCPSIQTYHRGISRLEPGVTEVLSCCKPGDGPQIEGRWGTNDLLLWDRGCLQQSHSKYLEKGTA